MNAFLGSTGYQPDGTGAAVEANENGLFAKMLSVVPVGKLPTGAGKLPALPMNSRVEMFLPVSLSDVIVGGYYFMG